MAGSVRGPAEQTYLGQRSLDRKTKELLQTVMLAAQGACVDHKAVAHGASHGGVQEGLECVRMPMGGLGLRARTHGVGKGDWGQGR
jgi:hypothetical protein